ncbi:MAG: hypothetical protein ACLQOO_25685, partial [Terriglobia bacterium]
MLHAGPTLEELAPRIREVTALCLAGQEATRTKFSPPFASGRVGEEAIPQRGTTTSPLVEPDVQISRIRLSRKLSPQGSTLV